MAGDQNTVEIDATLNTEKVKQGKADIDAMLADTKRMLEDLENPAANADASNDPLGIMGALEELGPKLAIYGGLVTTAFAVGAEAVNEMNTALDKTVEGYEKATEAVRKYYEQQEKGAEKGVRPQDRLGGKGFQSTMDDKTVQAVQELGAQDMGFAGQGTWTRRFEEIGNRVRGFFEGDFSGSEDQERRFNVGKKIAERQKGIDEADKREDERRKFEKDAIEHEQREARKAQADQHRRDQQESLAYEREEKQKEKDAERAAKEEERAFEKALAANERFHRNTKHGRGLGEAKDEFRSSVETDAMEVSRRMLAGNFSPHEQKMQAFEEKAAQQREVTNTIMAENLQNGRDVLQKLENMDGGLVA